MNVSMRDRLSCSITIIGADIESIRMKLLHKQVAHGRNFSPQIELLVNAEVEKS
jgi:hypothetical protein